VRFFPNIFFTISQKYMRNQKNSKVASNYLFKQRLLYAGNVAVPAVVFCGGWAQPPFMVLVGPNRAFKWWLEATFEHFWI
jgi:hypothetical protein